MSAAKDLYASMGWSQKVSKEDPIFEVGQRFTINDGSQKNLLGVWEIIDNNDSPHWCYLIYFPISSWLASTI